MSNVYKHKNCLKLNLWNCNFQNQMPEIDGHATVIFNIITTQFRLWIRPKCINGAWTELTEIVDYPEHVRQYVIENVYRRLRENCCEINITGAWDIDEVPVIRDAHVDDMQFIVDHYVGNYQARTAQLPNQWELKWKTDRPYVPPFVRRYDIVTQTVW